MLPEPVMRLLKTTDDLYTSLGLLALRIGTGGMMLGAHGWDKLVNFGQKAPHFPDPIGLGSTVALLLAVFAEFFCALGIIVGLLTRLASIPLMTTMLVAALVIHADDPWGKKEFALLYFVPFLALFAAGPGKFSVDARLAK